MGTTYNLHKISTLQFKRIHTSLLKLILILPLAFIFSGCNFKEKMLFNRAKSQYENNELAFALKNINKVISTEPRYTDAYVLRGNIKVDLGEFNDAVIDYTKAIEIDSTYSFAFLQRGFVFYYLGRYKDAIRDLSKALILDPSDEDALALRGDAYLAILNYDNAINDYTKCILIKGSNLIKAYSSRGYTKAIIKDYDGALADYLSAYSYKPEDYELLLAISSLKKQTNEFESAKYYCSKAIAIDSLYSPAFALRGQINDHLSNFKSSISDYTMAIKFDTTNCNYYLMRAASKHRLGLKEEGNYDLEKAIKFGYKFKITD